MELYKTKLFLAKTRIEYMDQIEDQKPSETNATDAGGVAARQGFRYQDHVAAQYVLEMINNEFIKQVECETGDDIVILWLRDGGELTEYVQVKTSEDCSKWSKAQVCRREKSRAPTSLMEKSLNCDCRESIASFRIVTKRDVNKSIKCLTIPLDGNRNLKEINLLAKDLKNKYSTVSDNGNDLEYWVKNTYWQVAGEKEAILAKNQVRIAQMAEQFGVIPAASHIKEIYDDLLNIIADAGEASDVTNPQDKILIRSQMFLWWQKHLNNTETVRHKLSKPYRKNTHGFFTEFHYFNESQIRRSLRGYDVGFSFKKWRSKELAEYLADWIPEIAIKASELIEIDQLNLRRKYQLSVQKMEREHSIQRDRLIPELLIHAILRHHFKSEPIACKLFYKGSSRKEKFSSAHIMKFDGKPDELWLGKAVIADIHNYEEILSQIVVDLEELISPIALKEEKEIIIALREPQNLLPTTLEKALEPYQAFDHLLQLISIPVLIAYDSIVLNGEDLKNYEQLLILEISEKYESLKKNLPSGVDDLEFNVHVFFIPIECARTLIRDFSEVIGNDAA